MGSVEQSVSEVESQKSKPSHGLALKKANFNFESRSPKGTVEADVTPRDFRLYSRNFIAKTNSNTTQSQLKEKTAANELPSVKSQEVLVAHNIPQSNLSGGSKKLNLLSIKSQQRRSVVQDHLLPHVPAALVTEQTVAGRNSALLEQSEYE